jgi:exodeoxyribonuclease VII large subunit
MNKFDNISLLIESINNEINKNYKNIITIGEVVKVQINEKFKMVFIELKDDKTSLNASIFLYKYKNDLTIGEKIIINGSVNVKNSRVNFKIIDYDKIGKGDEIKKRETALKVLKSKGFLDKTKKKEIKSDYNKIGIITSVNAAGCEDFINILKKRKNKLSIRIYDTSVQGKNAISEICNAIKYANMDNWANILVVIRGGGSRDDLSCFDELEVALSIGESILPIVTGIGHERDYSLSDEVADKSFITPTAVAEGITSNDKEINTVLLQLKQNINHNIHLILQNIYKDISLYETSLSNGFINNLLDFTQRLKNDLHNQIIHNITNVYNNFNYYEGLNKEFIEKYKNELKYLNSLTKSNIYNKLDVINNTYDYNDKMVKQIIINGIYSLKNKKIINTIDDFKDELKETDKFIIYLKGMPLCINIKIDE